MNRLAFLALASLLVGMNSSCPAVYADTAVAATSQPQAESAARSHAGRQDPMQTIGAMPFPHQQKAFAGHHGSHRGPVLQPPPPPVAVPINDPESIACPFLPGDANTAPPGVIQEVQLVSLMDEHAIIRVPASTARKHGWPTTIALNPGEHIGSLKLIATTTTQATFEEDGLRLTKGLAP